MFVSGCNTDDPRGAARRAQMLRFNSKRRGTIQYEYVYSIICYSIIWMDGWITPVFA